jgi:molybdate transport system regulatory protein
MNLKVKSKVWLENELGNAVIGDGRFRILKAIRDTGSISKAAVRIKQPFRRVRARLKDAEVQCGLKLVERSRAGLKLTAEGKDLMRKYAELNRVCTRHANTKFRKLFIDEEWGS